MSRSYESLNCLLGDSAVMFLIKDFKIKKVKNRGRGAFATHDIPAGTIIGDYLGTLIPDREENHKAQGLYCLSVNTSTVILADPKKIGVHLINHSCAPNSAMYPVGNHTIFFARRKIFRGEEITLDYLLGIDPPQCNPCKHYCFCGETFCRGTIHCSLADVNAYVAFEKTIQKKQKWSVQRGQRIRYGNQWLPLEKYPKSVPDHDIYKLYANEKKTPLRMTGKRLPSLALLRAALRTHGAALLFPSMGSRVVAIEKGRVVVRRG